MKSRCIRRGEAADADQVDDHLCHNCSFTTMGSNVASLGVAQSLLRIHFDFELQNNSPNDADTVHNFLLVPKPELKRSEEYPQLLPAV